MQTILVLFVVVWAAWAVIKDSPDIIWVVCYKLAAIWAPTKSCPLADSFFETYGVTIHDSGWKKDAVNHCLEFQSDADSGNCQQPLIRAKGCCLALILKDVLIVK